MRLGFLGTLHLDVFRQRLEDEYNSDVIITAPSVPYKSELMIPYWTSGSLFVDLVLTVYLPPVHYSNGTEEIVSNPTDFPEGNSRVDYVSAPMMIATILVPDGEPIRNPNLPA